MINYNKLRFSVIIITIAIYLLHYFQVVTDFIGAVVILTCFDISIVTLICKSIQDDEISISGSSILKHKNPKTYWVMLIVFIILAVSFTAVIPLVLMRELL